MHLSLSSQTRAGRLFLALAGLALLACDEEPPPPWHNHAPLPPSISGPAETWVSTPTSFNVTVYDPDGQDVVVYLDWGDGDTSQYGDFVRSGTTVTLEHAWRTADTFQVTGRCYDVYNPQEPLFSNWSNPVQVVVSRPDVR